MTGVHTTGDAPLTLAIVIATCDRWSHLREVLEQLRVQACGAPVWVMDQSGDVDREACAAWFSRNATAGFHHVVLDVRSLPNARNAGLSMTHEEVVIYLDDDVTLRPGLLEGHRLAYRVPEVGSVAGKVVETPSVYNATALANRVLWYGRVWSRLDGNTGGVVGSARGANMSFRRVALEDVGGFDMGYGGTHYLEDADAGEALRRAGWKTVYVPQAELLHHRAGSGGCRARDDAHYLYWRCHNTGRYQRKHRHYFGGVMGALYCALLGLQTRGKRGGNMGRCVTAYVRGWSNGKR